MNTSATTTPTNDAAISSIPSMKRSMLLRGGATSPIALPAISSLLASASDSAMLLSNTFLAEGLVPEEAGTNTDGRAPPARPTRQLRRSREPHQNHRSERRLVLVQSGAQFLQHHVGITPRLAHAVGPGLVDRFARCLPFLELLGGHGNDFVPGAIPELVDACRFEISPRIGKAGGPIVGAVIVDHLFLRSRHGFVDARIHDPLER